MKTLIVDIETTGLDSSKHKICELSVLLAESTWSKEGFNYEIVNSYSTRINPIYEEFCDTKAFSINRLSFEELKKAPLPNSVRMDFNSWFDEFVCDQCVPMGHGFSFDSRFLRLFFGARYAKYFHYHELDTYTLARTLGGIGRLDDIIGDFDKRSELTYRLSSLTQIFNIPHLTHTASCDARATVELYKRLVNIL